MFKEGFYEFKYEANSGVQHYIGVVNNIDLHSIMTTIHMFEGNETQDLVKKWRLSEGDMYKYINTFDNIHEVSKRIKDIEERKDWPVQVGQIWEVILARDNYNNVDCCYFIQVTSVKRKLENSFDVSIDVLHKHNTDVDDSYNYYSLNPNSDNLTLLTQEQYEQRVKELKRDEIKKGDYLLSDVIHESRLGKYRHIDLVVYDGKGLHDNQFAGFSLKRTVNGENKRNDAVHGYNDAWQRNTFTKITEQEALKILTGKDYVLLEDSKEKQIKELQEENKQLRKALVFHGVWPSEDHRIVGHYNEALNLKEASENAGKACKEYGEAINMATNSEIVSVTKNNPCTRIFKANNQDRTFTINYRDGMILDIHDIVLQLKEKFLS